MSNLVEVIKKAAIEAVEAAKPSDLIIGVVESASPLQIRIEQGLLIDEDFLILTKHVTDHYVDMSVSHGTSSNTVNVSHSHTYSSITDDANIDNHQHTVQGTDATSKTTYTDSGSTIHNHSYSGTTSQFDAINTTHSHGYNGRKKVLLHYGLKKDESVIMLRVQQGQKFIVLDRIGEVTTEGEWVE